MVDKATSSVCPECGGQLISNPYPFCETCHKYIPLPEDEIAGAPSPKGRPEHHPRGMTLPSAAVIYGLVPVGLLVILGALVRGYHERPIYLGASLVAGAWVWAAYRGAVHDSSLRYRTFWPRLWAQLVDGCVLMPLTLIAVVADSVGGSHVLVTGLSGVGSVGYFTYAVILHGIYGQTVGKRVTKVRVVDAKTGGRIRWWQAVVREAIPLTMSGCLLLEAVINPAESVSASTGMLGAPDAVWWLLTAVPLLWGLFEMVTMLTNGRRRALHDYIAGTVVERTSVRP